MSEQKQDSGGADFFAGLIFGLLVGAALAILAGPMTRDRLAPQASETATDLRQRDTDSVEAARQ